MSTPIFLETLRTVVGHMQVAHPEREAELARANALIRLGMVSPSPDDPETGQVLSSDGQKVYHVNGTCDCDAGRHGRGCKHVHGWRLYQYVQRKVEAHEPQDGGIHTMDTTPAPIEVPRNSEGPAPLPEAPASVNCHITVAGRQVQLTLRDTDEARLLVRLQTVLEQFPVEPKPQPQGQLSPQQHNALAMHKKVSGVCLIHQCQMQWNEPRQPGRKGWYSHRLSEAEGGGWCKGR